MEVAGSPASRSRFMQNSVMRVRGSLGLKLPSELSENGSVLIDTDSSTTARVEDDETLINTGLALGAADASVKAPHTNAGRPAHASKTKRLRQANKGVFIRLRSLSKTMRPNQR